MKSIGSIPIVYKEAAKPRTLADDNYDMFCQYHKDNPEIYELFVRLTLEMINSGRTRYSASHTLGRIKWDIDKRDLDADFSIPTQASPYYPRKFMVDYPKHSGFYHLRRLTTADKDPLTGKEKQVTFDNEVDYSEEELNEKLRSL